jgi:pimeloyl-ACP methyl ester carboxylesterase
VDATFDVPGAHLAATISGDGSRTLVWGHGLLSDRASEDELGLFDWSALDGVRLVRYDARGHGASSAPADPDELRWSALAQDMLAVGEAVGASRFVAGGASMGCATALHAAVAAPERVEALVLVIPPTAWETRTAQAQMYAAGVELFRRQP